MAGEVFLLLALFGCIEIVSSNEKEPFISLKARKRKKKLSMAIFE